MEQKHRFIPTGKLLRYRNGYRPSILDENYMTGRAYRDLSSVEQNNPFSGTEGQCAPNPTKAEVEQFQFEKFHAFLSLSFFASLEEHPDYLTINDGFPGIDVTEEFRRLRQQQLAIAAIAAASPDQSTS